MAEEKFSDNLLRLIAAQVSASTALAAARDMFGKSYFALGLGEKGAVDQAVLAMVVSNYHTLTPEFLAAQKTPATVGFPTQTFSPKPETS